MITDPPSPPPGPTSSDTGSYVSVEHAEVVPLPASPAQSYVEPAEEHASGETDRLLPTSSASEPASPVDAPASVKASVFSRLVNAMPSAPAFRCITFDYPAFQWRRLGRVRLPEDEEATAAAADQEAKQPSRFAGYWASIKKRQFRLRWWHYILILLVILSATIPPIVFAAVRHARRVRPSLSTHVQQ